MKTIIPFLALFLLGQLTLAAQTSFSQDDIAKIIFTPKPGAQVPGTLGFFDETGKHVMIEDYFHEKPVILILGYFRCPVLCSLVVNDVMENLRGLKGDAARNFDLVFVSIDPEETPAMATEKKNACVRSYGGQSGKWHFLTGSESSIRPLADALGFRYAYDPAVKQFAHPGGFVVLTPAGKISRYFMGVTFSTKELNEALHEAAVEKTSLVPAKLNLLCFHFAPLTGKYAGLVIDIIRGGGLLTLLGLGCFIFSRKGLPQTRRPR